MTYVITGASGTLGRLTADSLLEKVDPAEVVLVTRSPEKLEDLATRGAQVRAGDFDDPSSLAAAFAGAHRLLLISTDTIGRRVPQHKNAIDAAKAAGVGFIAYTSITNPIEDSPVGVNPEHRETERLIEESGIAHTFLRNAVYSNMEVGGAQGAIATGKFVHNRGDGKTAFVSRADCARAAAAVLAADGPLESAYDITGPELIAAEDSARIFAELRGEPVEAVDVDDETFIAGLVDHGVPAEAAPLFASFGQGIRGGHLDQLSDAVEQLTGRKPASVRTVLEGELAAA